MTKKTEIVEEVAAAKWLAQLEDGADSPALSEFETWRCAEPANDKAYERVSATRSRLAAFAETDEILALRQQTLSRVVRRRRARSAARLALTAPLIAGALVYSMQFFNPRDPQTGPASAPAGEMFVTAVGQRKAITLQDGSKVLLNTATRLRIAYGTSERRLTLEDGQAWFEVAHDPKRPFMVFAGGQRVEAHGTAFDIRTTPLRTEVMLAQGRVTVTASTRTGVSSQVELKPNDLLEVSLKGTSVRHVTDLSRWQSWREGRVVLHNVPLSEAIAEMNRYSSVRLLAADTRTARIRMSGSFNAGATQAFLEALASGFRVEGSRQDNKTIVLRRK